MSRKSDSTLADLKRELAEVRAERDEALAREGAVAEMLRVINASSGNLGPVFEAMLEKAMHLCGAAFGNLLTFDGKAFHPTAIWGDEALVQLMRDRGAFQPVRHQHL